VDSVKLEMHQNKFSAGTLPRTEVTTLPKLPSRLRRGHPSPFPYPLDAFAVSISPTRLSMISAFGVSIHAAPRFTPWTPPHFAKPGSALAVIEFDQFYNI